MKYLLFSLTVLLTSCAKFSDGQSVWAEGMWIIPTATLAGSIFFFIRAYQASRSGWKQDTLGEHKEGTENIPIYKTGWFIFAAALLVATIAIIIYQNSQK